MESVRASTTADGIAGALREEIQGGALAPGEPIRQKRVAARFGVSRIPVREALRRLEAEGLVVARPNRGTSVGTLDAEVLREAYELRALVESDLLAHAVPFRSTRLAGPAVWMSRDRFCSPTWRRPCRVGSSGKYSPVSYVTVMCLRIHGPV